MRRQGGTGAPAFCQLRLSGRGKPAKCQRSGQAKPTLALALSLMLDKPSRRPTLTGGNMETALQPDQPGTGAASRWSIISPLVAAVLVMLTFLTLSRPPLDLDVDTDTSLSAVLNYAHQHHLQFGTGLVFTYGPLGYLMFFYYSPHAARTRLVVETALCLTVAVGLCLVAWRLRLVWRCLLLGVFIFLGANIETRTDLVIETGCLCWGLLCFIESGRRLVLAAAAFTGLAAFGALAKVSILFGAGLYVVLLAGAMALRRQPLLGAGMLSGFCAGIALGWMAAGQDLSHLGIYLVNAFAVVRGYNQTLCWEALPSVERDGFLVLLLAVGAVVLRASNALGAQEKHRTWSRGLLLAWLGSFLFLAWKHGLAHGDSFHVVYFFGSVPVLAATLEVLPCESRACRLGARGLGAVACVLSVVTLQSWFFTPVARSLQQPFRNFGYSAHCLLRPAQYLRRMDEAVAARRDEARLPALRDAIGRARVDVFGERQVYAVLNDLNYRPRPVFQSYVACTPRLMRLNEQFYLSARAPEYVMFGLGGIDRRFPPVEDALALRDVLINYAPVGGEGGFMLLKAQAAQPARLALLSEGTVRRGKRIDLQGFGNTNLWLEVNLEPTVAGRLREFFYRPPTVRLAAWREPGKRLLTRRRAPAVMLAAGFLASPLLLRNEDVQDLYAGKPLSRPAAFSVELLPGQEHFWQEAVRFRVYGIQNMHVTTER